MSSPAHHPPLPKGARTNGSEEKSRKRPRAARACEFCRSKKYKCDEAYPCTQCKRLQVECVYKGTDNIHQRLQSSSYVAELEKRVQDLASRVSGARSESGSGIEAPANSAPGALAFNGSHDRRVRQSIKAERPLTSVSGALTARPLQLAYPDDGSQSDNESLSGAGEEVTDVNLHTKSTEFHGNTSSMAFLASVQQRNEVGPKDETTPEQVGVERPSLVSTLHNNAFSPDSHVLTIEATPQENNYYFSQSRIFLEGYFENLHFIHPILEREAFLARCEDLWFGRSENQSQSFVALYYSLMSLGALTRVWDQDSLQGLGRFQWSRKLFNHARSALGELGSTNDLETVQCLIFMAKVCQNELIPHLAYMYLGLAVRASLSAGLNREPHPRARLKSSAAILTAASRTWWGLYSLEIEMSFSLGRPDSLGHDEYHNRALPASNDSEVAILNGMASFARMIRKVSVTIYLARASVRDKMSAAHQIEAEMHAWLNELPDKVRPALGEQAAESRIMRDPKWARRQRLVLQLRYYNVQMVLYRPFLVYASRSSRQLPPMLEETVTKCVEAATKTIEVMHTTFCHHVFFRTWWYNTTYVLYAASIILCYATQTSPAPDMATIFRLVDMTLEVLETMDECVVARKAGEMIKQTVAELRTNGPSFKHRYTRNNSDTESIRRGSTSTSPDFDSNALLDFPMPSMSMDTEFDFNSAIFPMDDAQFLFWSNPMGLMS